METNRCKKQNKCCVRYYCSTAVQQSMDRCPSQPVGGAIIEVERILAWLEQSTTDAEATTKRSQREGQNTAGGASVAKMSDCDVANEIAEEHASKGERLVVLEPAVDDGTVVKTAGTLFFNVLEVIEGISCTALLYTNQCFSNDLPK